MLGLMLQWGGWGLGGFNFQDFLIQLEGFGFFQWILPFLLVFAVVYAILGEIPVFTDKKGPLLIVSLAIGLLSLWGGYVPDFFAALFSNFGIGVGILLVALILAGAFISGESSYKWIFFALGALIFVVVTFISLSDFQFIGSYWWQQYGGLIVVGLIIAGVIVAVVVGSGGGGGRTPRVPGT